MIDVFRAEGIPVSDEDLALGDAEAMFDIAWRLLRRGSPSFWPQQVTLANEISRWPRDNVNQRLLRNVLFFCACIELAEGQYDRFLQAAQNGLHRPATSLTDEAPRADPRAQPVIDMLLIVQGCGSWRPP